MHRRSVSSVRFTSDVDCGARKRCIVTVLCLAMKSYKTLILYCLSFIIVCGTFFHVFNVSAQRKVTYSSMLTFPNEPFQESLCSDRATARGANQRVVSFNFFGPVTSDRLYFFGIAHNARFLPHVYPNWTMRVYHSIREDDFAWPTLAALEQVFPHLDLCNASALPVLGNVNVPEPTVWRYLPLGDPLVSIFVSRDLESYVLPRELAAVAEWLSSNLTFHVMRDNKPHTIPMLAGLWGAKRYQDPDLSRKFLKEIFRKMPNKGKYGYDQDCLGDIIWPEIKGMVMQHDSYNCETFRAHGNMRPFPTRRENDNNNWVGFRLNQGGSQITITCPEECRPADHKDWVNC